MAIRYSADTEIRVWYDTQDHRWHGTVRDPKGRWAGAYRPAFRLTTLPSRAKIDRAAQVLVSMAESAKRRRFAVERKNGVVQVSPMFQAACPCDELPKRDRDKPSLPRAKHRKRHA